MTDWNLRPARDHGLTPAERLRSTGREPGLGSLLTAGLWRGLTRLYLRAAHDFQVHGRENLPQPPFIIVANHSSHLDAIAVAAALPRSAARHAYALAAGDTFFTNTPTAAFAAYAINALPVWRKRTTARDLQTMRQRLTEDRAVLILFPEGTRTRTGTMAPFQPGIGALIAGSPIPVVPAYLAGAHACWPATRRWPRPGPLTLTIGPPLHFGPTQPGRAGLTAIAAECEAAVRSLAPPEPAA